ncbi:hypothetical protein RFI_20723 [Reticulomyxa filosa]|uniref:FAD dependent oxidoreductase domain-containing protein n=1 Tax=Reticulomyxa filosa TaxID=46433 RepID=X6MT37_RETFI|nr:hypothetical protein RFI_20723 [Reticulomyxa filosa]|eukprot:ETO16617.1 hypothetical protein RFI_20723 [Reticulomyxa filosa]
MASSDTKREPKRKVVVIGAGIVGVTTAYKLAKDGYHVTVVEKYPAAAQFLLLSLFQSKKNEKCGRKTNKKMFAWHKRGIGVANEYKDEERYKNSVLPVMQRSESNKIGQVIKSAFGHLNPMEKICPSKFHLQDNTFCDPSFLSSQEGAVFSFYLFKRQVVDKTLAKLKHCVLSKLGNRFEGETSSPCTTFQKWRAYCWDKFLYTLFDEAPHLDKINFKVFDGYAHVYPQSGGNGVWGHLRTDFLPKEYSPFSKWEELNHNVRTVEDHGKALAGSCHDLAQFLVDRTKDMGVEYKFNTEFCCFFFFHFFVLLFFRTKSEEIYFAYLYTIYIIYMCIYAYMVKRIFVDNGKISGVYTKDNEMINTQKVIICGGALSSHLFNRLIYEHKDDTNEEGQFREPFWIRWKRYLTQHLPFLPVVPLQGYAIQTNCQDYPYPYSTHIFWPGRIHVTHVKDDRIHITNYGYFRPIQTVLERSFFVLVLFVSW